MKLSNTRLTKPLPRHSSPPPPRPHPPTLTPQIQGLPTMIFISTDDSKPALRCEGLMTAETIKGILRKDLAVQV